MSHFWTKSNFTYPPLEDLCSRSLDPPHYYTLSAVLLLELPYTDLLSLHIFQKLWLWLSARHLLVEKLSRINCSRPFLLSGPWTVNRQCQKLSLSEHICKYADRGVLPTQDGACLLHGISLPTSPQVVWVLLHFHFKN